MKLTLLIATVLLGACHTPIGHDKQENTYTAMEGGHELMESHEDVMLGPDIEVDKARSTRNEMGFLVADFDLVNTVKNRVGMEWTMRWHDEADQPVPSPRPWSPIFIDVGKSKHMTLVAPTKDCVKWILCLRSPHESN